MFPGSGAPSGRRPEPFNGLYAAPPASMFLNHSQQSRPLAHSFPLPGLDQLPSYNWKNPPTNFAILPPPPHIPPRENGRKRQHDDHPQPAVKRQRLDPPVHPPVISPVIHAQSPLQYPARVVAESSSSSSNPVSNHQLIATHHSSSTLRFQPHPSEPENFDQLNVYAKDKLSNQMVKLFEACHQQSSDLERKETIRVRLLRDIRQIYAVARLYLTGSSMNGLGCRSSDADLCLVIHTMTKNDAIVVLCHLQKVFRTLSYIERIQLIRAKVPILRFREKGSDLEFDLNVNNTVGIRNTFLLRSYAYADVRIRPLILGIKKWAQHSQINDASKGTLSSYTLVLMALNYLQTLKEPVLPSLQKDFPGFFNPLMDLDKIPEGSKRTPPYISKNQSSLGDLLAGFLKYYATDFRWDKQVISIRDARTFPRTNAFEWRNKFICVEEPFEGNNVARAVHEKPKFDAIRDQFHTSWKMLQKTKDLNSILPVRYIIKKESSQR